MAEDVYDDGTGPIFEIVNGERVEKPMILKSTWVGSRLMRRIGNHLEEHDQIDSVACEPFIVCFQWNPKLKRRPDVAYWREEHWPREMSDRGEIAAAPAWAVEVLSPHDNAADLNVKLDEYFRAGVELAWIVDPQTRIVHTEQPNGAGHTYREGEKVSAAPVLPQFNVAVADLFPAKSPAAAGG